MKAAIAITRAEWRAWNAFKELRTSTERWVNIEIGSDGVIDDPKAINELFQLAPDLIADSEQDILVVIGHQIENGRQVHIHSQTKTTCISNLSRVTDIFALSEFGHNQNIRLPGRPLSEPRLEQAWLHFRADNEIRRSLQNARIAASNLAIEREDFASDRKIFSKNAEHALGVVKFSDVTEKDWVRNLTADLFKFTRKIAIEGGNDPSPTHTDRDFCIDLGLMARRRLGDELNDGFKEFGKILKTHKEINDLVTFIADPAAESALALIHQNEPSEFVFHPEAHMFFLKWKNSSLEDENIVWDPVLREANRLATEGKTTIGQQALYLLTSYAGPCSLSNYPDQTATDEDVTSDKPAADTPAIAFTRRAWPHKRLTEIKPLGDLASAVINRVARFVTSRDLLVQNLIIAFLSGVALQLLISAMV